SPVNEGLSRWGGDPFGPYQLTARSKYYLRESGVTGIHEARQGSFPPSATIYGYHVDFSNYGFSYRDGMHLESRAIGKIEVGGPATFPWKLEELKLTCLGALDTARVPANPKLKQLEYWRADFLPMSIEFRSHPWQKCDPAVGFLVLGVQAW